MSKKSVLRISGLYALYFVGLLVSDYLCHSSWCRVRDDDFLGWIFFLFMPLLWVFVLSLITYKMQEAVFQAWWRFAMWFVPLIMIVTYFFYSGHQQSGFGGVAQDAFYFAILVALYAIFILTSLIRIILAYRRSKQTSV